MLEVIGSSLLALLGNLWGRSPQTLPKLDLAPWHEARIFNLPADKDEPKVREIVERYLSDLSQQGIDRHSQGIWLQSDWLELDNRQGIVPISAASLTKIATTLAALGKLGVDYRFITGIYHTGSIQNGVLKGDLVVEGGKDPFFVWEEAIALSNALNQLGIKKIEGDLLVNQQFYMNYKSESLVAGKLLKQGLEPNSWSEEVKQQFQKLPLMTPRPQLTITGEVRVISHLPARTKLLILHESLPLSDILQQMNIYSNNKIAQMLAEIVGGAATVADYAITTTGVSTKEIQLVNGSGLGLDNRISPRAAVEMLMAIDDLLQPHDLTVMDIFPVGGRDIVGTMENRQLPPGVAIKTGTLNQVSALAGVIPLQDKRQIWFAVVNSGWQVTRFRQQQDRLLQQLAELWQLQQLSERQSNKIKAVYLGDPKRNRISDRN